MEAAFLVTSGAELRSNTEFATSIKIRAPYYAKEIARVRNTPVYPSFWE